MIEYIKELRQKKIQELEIAATLHDQLMTSFQEQKLSISNAYNLQNAIFTKWIKGLEDQVAELDQMLIQLFQVQETLQKYIDKGE